MLISEWKRSWVWLHGRKLRLGGSWEVSTLTELLSFDNLKDIESFAQKRANVSLPWVVSGRKRSNQGTSPGAMAITPRQIPSTINWRTTRASPSSRAAVSPLIVWIIAKSSRQMKMPVLILIESKARFTNAICAIRKAAIVGGRRQCPIGVTMALPTGLSQDSTPFQYLFFLPMLLCFE